MVGAGEVPLEGGPENWWMDKARLLGQEAAETAMKLRFSSRC